MSKHCKTEVAPKQRSRPHVEVDAVQINLEVLGQYIHDTEEGKNTE